MTKKLLSQKSEKSEISEESSTNNDSTNSSIYTNGSERKTKNENLLSTPLKKVRKNIIFPVAPKKKKKTLEYEGLILRGKNLFNIFESM